MRRLTLAVLALPSLAMAQEVGITRDMQSVTVGSGSEAVEIARIQDRANHLTGDWALTSRACPPFCIQPISPAEGVTTIGELELLEMLQDPEAVVIDSRVTSDFEGGSIPGALSIPYTEMVDHLGELGCEIDFDGWDCDAARPIAMFCNGPWCGQSPTAIRRIIEAGFPAGQIHYYRGGMQVWRLLGLTVSGE